MAGASTSSNPWLEMTWSEKKTMALAADSASAKRWTLTLRNVVPLCGWSVFVGDEVAEGIAGPAPIVEQLRGLLGAAQRRDHLLLAAFGLVGQNQSGRHLGLRGKQLEEGPRLRRDVAVTFGRLRRMATASAGDSSSAPGWPSTGAAAVGVTVARAFGSCGRLGGRRRRPRRGNRGLGGRRGCAGGTISPRMASRKNQPMAGDGGDQHHRNGNPAQSSPLAALPARQQGGAAAAPGA